MKGGLKKADASREEDSILDQMYIKQICFYFYFDDLKLELYENAC